MVRPLVCIAIGIAMLAPSGCASDGEWSVRKMLGWDDPMHPSMDKYPKPDYAVGQRVDDLGKRIVVRNTFIGIDPMFHTIGVPEPVLFHRGPEELFISEGLVKQCKTDAELAAVMCSELGQMIAEKQAARRAGANRDRDSIPDAALCGMPCDVSRQAQLAYDEQRSKSAPSIDTVDAAKKARGLLSEAGFDPALLDQVQPLLKQSDRSVIIRKQMSGAAPAPTWMQ